MYLTFSSIGIWTGLVFFPMLQTKPIANDEQPLAIQVISQVDENLLTKIEGLQKEILKKECKLQELQTENLAFVEMKAQKDETAAAKNEQEIRTLQKRHDEYVKNLKEQNQQLQEKLQAKEKAFVDFQEIHRSIIQETEQHLTAALSQNKEQEKEIQKMSGAQILAQQQSMNVQMLKQLIEQQKLQLVNLERELTTKLEKEKTLRLSNESLLQQLETRLVDQKQAFEKIEVSRKEIVKELETTRHLYATLLKEFKERSSVLHTTENGSLQVTKRRHRVNKGESLTSIAVHYYGTANKWQQIYEANQDQLPNHDKIQPGTELIIP